MTARIILLVGVLALPDPATAQSGPPPGFEQYVGIYRDSTHRELVISPLRVGDGWALLLADLRTDAIRLLAPQAGTPDEFAAGATLAHPTPAVERFHFLRDASGNVGVLERSLADSAGPNARRWSRKAPVRSESLRFTSGAVVLEGTLWLPDEPGPFPAIVLAHGSESNDRHSFGPVPLALVARGFAVFAYDKRGTGRSTGSWHEVGIEPIADDLVAVIRAVRGSPHIRRDRVGVYGTSEGGWVAARAAATSDAAFVVTVSGGALTKADAYVHKVRRQVESAGLPAAAADSTVREAERVANSARLRARRDSGASGFDRRLAYDPTADWVRYAGPVLHLEGEWDVLEPGARSAEWYEALHRNARHADATVKLFPKAHHSLLLGVNGTAREFETMAGVAQMVPGYWDVLFRWLDQRAFPVRSTSTRRPRGGS